MGLNGFKVAVGAVLVLGVLGCDPNPTKTITIDGHVFRVPVHNLVWGTIPWLPARQNAGLRFVVDPDVPLPEQSSVLIESSRTLCHPQRVPQSQQFPEACAGRLESVDDDLRTTTFNVRKAYPYGVASQWEYRISSDKQALDGAVVAACFALASGTGGLCQSRGFYNGLVYSVGLRDQDIDRVATLRKRVRALLASWETHEGK
ncbi:MAG TPA: hypothetical protein VGN07_22450 [Steroidobacteraceae bacterium]